MSEGNRKQEEGNDRQNDETKLCKTINQATQNDPHGVLYVIYETIQEITAAAQVDDDIHPESENEDGFQSAPSTPGGCTFAETGPLLTNEEVSNAIQRNKSSLSKPIEIKSVNAEEPEQRLLLSRKKKKERKKQEKEQPMQGIFGTPIKHSKWSLNRYFQSVASTREKRIIAVSAWILALIGLIVSLVFVTKDFLDSRKELSSTVRFEESPTLDLPPLFFCSADSEIPPFMDFPSQPYLGKPLMWLEYVRGLNVNVTYPETMNLKQLSVGSYDVMGRRCNASEFMDPQLYLKENTERPSCFYCLALSRYPPLTIQRERDTAEGISFSRMTSVRLSQNSFISHCRMSQFGLTFAMLKFFKEELRTHHKTLADRGVLDFGSLDPEDRGNDGLLWPAYRLGLRNTSVDFVVYDIVDMFCNVYLFSGLFYPSRAEDIRFKFDDKIFRWERSGSGPYYPEDFFDYYTTSEDIGLFSGTSLLGKEKYENKSIYDSSTILVRTNESRIGGVETLAVVRPSEVTSVELSRNMIREKESFVSDVIRTDLFPGDVRTVNNVYLLDIGFKSFLTRVVSDQQSVSWSAFAADFFGLTSLFMDVSVYTLIVSPLVVRGRQRALAARRRRLEAETTQEV